MLKQVRNVVVTIAALTPLFVAVAISASAPTVTISDQATDTEPTWTFVRYASKPIE